MSIQNIEVPNDISLYCGNISIGGGNSFNRYNQTDYDSPFTGVVSGDCVGLARQIDRSYIISIAAFAGTGSGVAGTINFTDPLPYVVWSPISIPLWVQDGGVYSMGRCAIDEDGNIVIYKGYNGNFTATGTCGFDEINIVFASYLT
jgi:hypothetical protein